MIDKQRVRSLPRKQRNVTQSICSKNRHGWRSGEATV
jgi:hypothetical protein